MGWERAPHYLHCSTKEVEGGMGKGSTLPTMFNKSEVQSRKGLHTTQKKRGREREKERERERERERDRRERERERRERRERGRESKRERRKETATYTVQQKRYRE